MKRTIAIVLVFAMIFAMVGCASSTTTTDETAAEETATEAPAAEETAAEETTEETEYYVEGLDISGYSPYIQKLIYDAHQNNETLMVYGACDESYVNAAAYHFQELFGIETSAIRYATGEMYTKTEEEKDNPQCDVWFGGSNDYYIKAKEAGLLDTYEPENEKNLIDTKFIDPDYQWFGIYTGVLGMMVNTEEIEALGLTAPTSWADLTDPQWEGLISVANPQTSATATNFLATMHYVYGYPDNLDNDGLMEFFKAFDKNVYMYTKSGSGPSKMVGPGEIVVGISFLHDGIAQIVNGYDNIQLVVPSEGTGWEVGACGIVKSDKNMNAKKLFIEYCLSAECVNLGKDNSSYQNLVITDEAGAIQPQELVQWGLDDLSKCNLVPYDVTDVAPKLEGWTQEWLNVITADDRLKTE